MNNKTSQVILASGELYPKSSLQPGMMLFGADSKHHELKGVESRMVPAFEVQRKKSEPFLMGFDQKVFAYSKTREPLLLRAADYVELSQTFRNDFCLAKSALDFPKQELPLDPYFMGLLLGNGCFRNVPIALTTPDAEIREALYEIAARYQWPVSIHHLPENLSDDYRFKRPPKGNSSLKQIIAALGLYNHKSNTKFIPKVFLYADRQSREALLAGLLDTDGWLHGKSYEIKSSSPQLANDIAFLARSLGFLVLERETTVKGKHYARLYIHGDFSKLPIRIKRKISLPRLRRFKDGFSLKQPGIQDIPYLDIESYLLGDFTVQIGGVL